MKNPQLRCIAVFENEFQAAVMVKISENEGAAVLRKVQSKRARHLGERTVAVVRKGYISFVATPGIVRPNQFVQSIPSMLIRQRGRGVFRRFRYHLPPEKAAEVIPFQCPLRCGDVSIGNVEVRITVMVEVPQIRAPGPAAHLNPGLLADVLKRPIPFVPIERIASRVLLVKRPNVFRSLFLKALLR